MHPSDHVFLKIKEPTARAGRDSDGKMQPLLQRNIYSTALLLPPSGAEEDEQHKKKAVKIDERRQKSDHNTHHRHHHYHRTCPRHNDPTRTSRERLPRTNADLAKGATDDKEGHSTNADVVVQPPTTGASYVAKPRAKLLEEITAAKQRKREEKVKAKIEAKITKLEAKLAERSTASEAPAPSAPPPQELKSKQQKGHGKYLDAEFLADTTFPDDSVVPFGAPVSAASPLFPATNIIVKGFSRAS